MIVIQADQNFSFNYTTYDQNDSLFVGFNVYDVTTGTPVFLQLIEATYAGFGSYVGSYLSEPGKTYVVIGVVYTNGSFNVVDTTRSPSSDVYQVFSGAILDLGFVYSTYDFSSSLSVQATVYNTTNGTPVLESTVVMDYINFGVYYGSYAGEALQSFQVIGVVYTNNTYATPNLNYAPSSDSFECVQAGVGIIGAAYLVSQYGQTVNFGPRVPRNLLPPIFLTQGDVATLHLKAVDVNGMPVDLSGASFTTYINGENGQAVQSFLNIQHTANPDQVNFRGDYTLALSSIDTSGLGLGSHKEVLTSVVVGGTTIYFRGYNILGVLPPVPLE
jgi:hypothetical protein